MPNMPLRPCLNPVCAALVIRGRCPNCARAHAVVKQAREAERPSRHARNYGYEWEKIRDAQLKRKPWCFCGKKASDVDHIVPRVKGGTDAEINLQSLCHAHHSQKTAKETQLWKTPRR